MRTNVERFKTDLEHLVTDGRRLDLAMRYECDSVNMEKKIRQQFGKKSKEFIRELPSFSKKYQRWYSEALTLLQQVLPDRVADFVRHYEKPKNRKSISFESYRIEDYLQGLIVCGGYPKEIIVDTKAALPHFRQQLAIVEAAQARFESSLFDIRQLVLADLLDTELDAADVLAKHGFTRAAGALGGVVLERHLSQVCEKRKILIGKKNPTIGDFNEALKAANIVELPQWRFIQHLADIRNLCDHSRKPEPTSEQVSDLLAGVKKMIKTVY